MAENRNCLIMFRESLPYRILGVDAKAQTVWQKWPPHTAFFFNLQRMPERNYNCFTWLLENCVCCTQELSEHTNHEIQEDAGSLWRCINDSNCAEEDGCWRNLQLSSTYRTKEDLHLRAFPDINTQQRLYTRKAAQISLAGTIQCTGRP
jgi:hypothetical protein